MMQLTVGARTRRPNNLSREHTWEPDKFLIYYRLNNDSVDDSSIIKFDNPIEASNYIGVWFKQLCQNHRLWRNNESRYFTSIIPGRSRSREDGLSAIYRGRKPSGKSDERKELWILQFYLLIDPLHEKVTQPKNEGSSQMNMLIDVFNMLKMIAKQQQIGIISRTHFAENVNSNNMATRFNCWSANMRELKSALKVEFRQVFEKYNQQLDIAASSPPPNTPNRKHGSFVEICQSLQVNLPNRNSSYRSSAASSGRSPSRSSGRSSGVSSGRSPRYTPGVSSGRSSGRSPGVSSDRSPRRSSGRSPRKIFAKSEQTQWIKKRHSSGSKAWVYSAKGGLS